MLKIYGHIHSASTQPVLWSCQLLGIEYELISTGGAHGGNKDADYLRLNPNGLVPTLVDGDFVLWESGAILCHLARRAGNKLLPPECQSLAYQWILFAQSTIYPTIKPLYMVMIRNQQVSDHERQQRIDNNQRVWSMVDQGLEGRDFLAGDQMTVADINIASFAYRWFSFDIDRGSNVNLEAWYSRMREIPGFAMFDEAGLR